MNAIVNHSINAAKKLATFALEYSCIAQQWALKFFRIRAQGWSRCSARKRFEKISAELGMEVYSAYKNGRTGWESQPSVQQRIRSVEEAEMGVFNVNDTIQQINEKFQVKKEEIHEAFAARRATMGRNSGEE